jgi:YVTN family beta-propeller protein
MTNTIIVGNKPYTVSVNPYTHIAYVANHNNSTATVIDANLNSVIDNIVVGRIPSSISINPITNTIYVANVNGGTVTVIDGKINKAIPVNS